MNGEMIRYIFPRKSTCPECAGKGWRAAGRSRCDRMEYRECKNKACGQTYKVWHIGIEVDEGGLVSVIRPA